MIEATVANGPVMIAYGIMSLATGVAMTVGHNVWSGGPLPVVVTLVGWLILAKGILILFLPPEELEHRRIGWNRRKGIPARDEV